MKRIDVNRTVQSARLGKEKKGEETLVSRRTEKENITMPGDKEHTILSDSHQGMSTRFTQYAVHLKRIRSRILASCCLVVFDADSEC